MHDDSELLRLYAEEKSDAAFAELVNRHVNLVYTVALRRVNGDTQLAEDVAQIVFTDLARKAGSLVRHPALGAWLFRSARFAAGQARRAEKRREAREREAYLMDEIAKGAAPDPDWTQLRPVLDDVMDELPERDRVAVWLRVCEGKPFSEISAILAASEDAVRMRVERAIEKMRGALGKRGIVSTTAALTSALAQESGVAMPVGFATSVAGTALANASGSGLAAWWGISTFMNTTNVGAWGAAAAIVLASLAGNAYWLSRSSAPSRRAALLTSVEPQAVFPANTDGGLALLSNTNLALLRDQLRASGADESAIRAMLEGLLRRHYREKLLEDRVERARAGWWRDPLRERENPNSSGQSVDDPQLLREMVTLPLEKLLGPDPLAVAEAEAKYAFLPPDLRQAFGRLDREAPSGFRVTGQIEVDGEIEAEYERQRLAVDDKRKGLLASLTPAERTEWEARLSPLATALGRQLDPIGGTEAEYRMVFPIAESLAKERTAKVPPGIELQDARDDIEQRGMQALVDTLGYDRALDYIWGGAIEYSSYARVARDANLPASTAGRVLQLAAETAAKAAMVHGDTTMTVEQKRAALVALKQSVQPQLDALVPPSAQQRLVPGSQVWFTSLGGGNYKTIRAAPLGVNSVMIVSPQSVASPPPARLGRAQLLPPHSVAR